MLWKNISLSWPKTGSLSTIPIYAQKTIHIASVHKKSRKTTFMQSDKLQYMSWKHNDMINNMVSLETDFKQGQRKAWCIPIA